MDFEEQLEKHDNRKKTKKPKADSERVSSAGQSGDRKHKREVGENGDRERKRVGGENGDRERKGGDRSQQQAVGRAADVEDKRNAGREGGRVGGVEDERKAGQEGGKTSELARCAAARRRRGQDDAASIDATDNISRFSAVRDRVEKANGIPVLEAIELNIFTLRTLRSDESSGYIALVRTFDRIRGPFPRAGPTEEGILKSIWRGYALRERMSRHRYVRQINCDEELDDDYVGSYEDGYWGGDSSPTAEMYMRRSSANKEGDGLRHSMPQVDEAAGSRPEWGSAEEMQWLREQSEYVKSIIPGLTEQQIADALYRYACRPAACGNCNGECNGPDYIEGSAVTTLLKRP
jgi:hypothetical protein